MKKFTALLLSLILLCGIFTVTASAATNYCEEFNTAVSMLRWWIDGSEVKEGENFPTKAVIRRTLFSIDENKYATEKNGEYVLTIEVPAADFEAVAAQLFAKFSIAELHADESYDEAKNAYTFDMGGGMGDSSHYLVYGYTGTSKYTVYSAFVEGSEPLDSAPEGKTEGKDYVREDDNFYLVMHWLKTVVEKGSEVKFHSWEKVAAAEIPTSGLTRNEKTLEKKPEATSSQVTSSATSSESNITSNAIVSETSSAVEEKYETVVQTQEVTVEAVENAFPEGTVVNVVMVTDEAQLQVVKTALKKLTHKFVAYDITAKSDNVTVQPDGTVKATFAIPEGYDHSKVGVIYVSDDGKTETVPSVVNKETGKVVAQLSHFSTYAVVELNEAPVTDEAKAGMPAFAWVLIFVGVILALGGGGTALYFLYFKKKGIIK